MNYSTLIMNFRITASDLETFENLVKNYLCHNVLKLGYVDNKLIVFRSLLLLFRNYFI